MGDVLLQRVRHEPVLIGPMNVGKTTIGTLLAKSFSIPIHSIDAIRERYYLEIGYDTSYADRLLNSKGLWALYQYWKIFEIYALERLFVDYKECVFDLGAGHSVYEDPAQFRRAQRAFSAFKNIILLLPSADIMGSLRALKQRDPSMSVEKHELNLHFLQDPSNRKLATRIIYTDNLTEAEVCKRIIDSCYGGNMSFHDVSSNSLD
jgi:shikimate kinase